MKTTIATLLLATLTVPLALQAQDEPDQNSGRTTMERKHRKKHPKKGKKDQADLRQVNTKKAA